LRGGLVAQWLRACGVDLDDLRTAFPHPRL
jgi:hypothetical protein